ncbi:MAG: tetratricopeptide repeat protein, partial [Candidatus Aminicenantia bacterium]
SELSVSENELLKSLDEIKSSYIYSFLSEIYLHRLEFEKAELMAESALRVNPSNINAHLILGNIYLSYLRSGKGSEYIKKAEEIYKNLISLDPSFPDPYYILGKWIYMPSSRWKEAEEFLKRYSELSQYKEEAYILLGEISKKTGDYNKSEEYYRKAIEQNPMSYLAYSYLGELYSERGDIKKEIETYTLAIEAFSESYIFYQRLAEAYTKKNDLNSALNMVNKGLEISPFNSELLLTKAKILLNMKKFAEFQEVIGKIQEKYPELLEARVYLVEYYMETYEYQKAVDILLGLEREENHDFSKKEIYKNLGYLFTLMKDLKSAKYYLEKSLELGKEDPSIYSYLSYIYKELGDSVSALKMAEEGLKINPGQKSLLVNKIYAISRIGDTETALNLAKEGFEKNRDFDFLFAGLSILIERKEWDKGEKLINYMLERKSDNEEVYLRVGDFYEKKGEFKRAEKAVKKAISLNPNFSNAINYLAYSWAERGKNLDKALNLAKKAVNLDPENPDYLDTIGWICFKLGKISEAKKYLEKAVSKKPWEPEILEHMGFLKIKEGKEKEGIEFFEKSLEMGSENKEVIEKLIKELKKKYEGVPQKSE